MFPVQGMSGGEQRQGKDQVRAGIHQGQDGGEYQIQKSNMKVSKHIFKQARNLVHLFSFLLLMFLPGKREFFLGIFMQIYF